MTLNKAIEYIGGLSTPSKMPCYSYSIPARKCKTGSKLRKIKGSVCAICYCLKGRYNFNNVQNAQNKRFKSIFKKYWVEAMTIAINKLEKSGYFRFHDAGDIQNEKHLDNICRICKNLPHIKFWLPSREYRIVSNYIIGGNKIPDNLTIRLSAYTVDGQGPTILASKLGVLTSGVSNDSFTCPSSKQDGECKNCRACWDKHVSNVNYKAH
jgi:hypothetical protein